LSKPTGWLLWSVFVIGAGALALYTYRAWGLKGSAALLAIWTCVYLGARLNRLRMQRRIRRLLASLPESQRAEVIAAMRKEPES
jgi:uncharacterized membrane protein YfcA